MIPPGFKTIRALLTQDVHAKGEALKGDLGWDEFVTSLIERAHYEKDAKVPAKKGGGK